MLPEALQGGAALFRNLTPLVGLLLRRREFTFQLCQLRPKVSKFLVASQLRSPRPHHDVAST